MILIEAYGYDTDQTEPRLVNPAHIIRAWPDQRQTEIQGVPVVGILMTDQQVLYTRLSLPALLAKIGSI